MIDFFDNSVWHRPTIPTYCNSINVCVALIVQISRVVENRKLLWPQTFFSAFRR